MPHYVDPDNIFPKRLGVLNSNTIVIEYYDLIRDKFKKHPIPYNPQQEVKIIIDQIFKNTNHFPFLKKVDPKHIKSILQGHTVRHQPPKKSQRQNFDQFTEAIPISEQKKPKQEIFQTLRDNQNKMMSNDSQISNGSKKKQQQAFKPNKPQQIDDQYADEFEQFQISQSMQKGSKTISSISNVQKSKPSQQQSNSSSSVSKSKPQSKIQKSSVIEQSIQQEYADDFQFVDEQPKKKQQQKKKEKKQKKQKSKSKEKKPKKEKKQKIVKIEKQVEEQFQFL